MKILKVKEGQTVHINHTVFVTVKRVNYHAVRLAFNADPSVTIALVKEGRNEDENN